MRFAVNRKLAEFSSEQDWDSTLWARDIDEGGNVTLKIRIRVHFRTVEVRNGPQVGYYQEEDDRFGTIGWDKLIWEQWQAEYCRVISSYWAKTFWLLTPEKYKELERGNHKPNVSCAIEVEPAFSQGGAHYTFNIIRVADYRVNRAMAGGNGFTGWLADVERIADANNQVRIVNLKHAAHLFYLPHRTRDWANNNRYFRFQSPIVGTGDSTAFQETQQDRTFNPGAKLGRSTLHARPWQMAMERHSGLEADQWEVTTSQLIAEKTRGFKPLARSGSSSSSSKR
ncbi:MAG: hypothetical protein HY820_07160 [Acidobacteria bacterium]|nr:hypothetical protein [Acidobacteriota bacterium]